MLRFRYFLFYYVLLHVGVGFCQNKVDKLFENHAYFDVIPKYEKLLKKDSVNVDIIHKLAVSYTHINNSKAALDQYEHIINLGASEVLDNYDWNEIGQLYLRFEDNSKAELAFHHLEDSNSYFNKRQVPSFNRSYKSINLENINTKFSEFSPYILDNEIVFTSDRSYSLYGNSGASSGEKSYLSLFVINNESNIKKKEIKKFSGKINSGFENGTASFSLDGKVIFYTKSSPGENGVNHSKIYSAELSKGKWKKIHSILLNNEGYSLSHPIYFDSLKMLVFSSDMPEGYGGMDLYYSFTENGVWSDPINFGPLVNTRFNEVFPSKKDNKSNEIYFSSNGRFGFGGLDIYKMIFTNNKVVSVEILPEGLNSNRDDFGICFNSDSSGYVSSDRAGGLGADDIYEFSSVMKIEKVMPLIEVKPFKFSGSIFDEETGLPIVDHKMYLFDVDNRIIDSTQTNIEGVFHFGKLPFVDVAISPAESEDKEVSIKMKSTASKEHANGMLYLMTSKKKIVDSVYLAEGEVLTFYMESSDVDNKHKCVVYEDGIKAVKIVYVQKDSSGLVLDSVDHATACLTIRKMFPEKELITIINDEDAQLIFGISDKLEITKEKDTIIVESIYFEVDEIKITEAAKVSLVKIIHALEQYPSVKLKVLGYTDSHGEKKYNLSLSMKRAEAIKNYLVLKGIKESRLSSVGFGESKLTNHCKDGVDCSEAEHFKNRRTEFELTWD